MHSELAGRVQQIEKELQVDDPGFSFFDYQLHCFSEADQLLNGRGSERMCLYYKTGAGKSITALVTMKLWGYDDVLVITPPSTYSSWEAIGVRLGMKISCMSHAKFRMSDTKVDRARPIIADEMHLFGSHKGKGWKKLDRLSGGLKAPLILASATPSYNDADRVYCVQHILQPKVTKGGFLQFLYENCVTEQNHFSTTPDVISFKAHKDAEAYLAAMPGVMYVEDDLVYTIDDVAMAEKIPPEFQSYGYDRRRHKMIGSQMEERHQRTFMTLVKPDGHVEDDVLDYVNRRIKSAGGNVLIYADHSTVADALAKSLTHLGLKDGLGLITGATSKKNKQRILDEFRSGGIRLLIGTASLATGTDGMDKICDTLIIVDDTSDASLRRQLIGRIMPRGKSTNASSKQVHRLVLQ